MRLLLPALVVAAACAPRQGEPACWAEPFEVLAEDPAAVDCTQVAADVQVVQLAFDGAPARWQVPADRFAETFGGLSILIHAEPTFARDGRSWVGRTSVDGRWSP